VDGLLAELSSTQFAEWMAYDRIEPILTGDVLEYAVARLAALTANLWAQKTRPFTADDFIPRKKAPVVARTPEEDYRMLKTWAMLNQPANKLLH
jgi:hypothetical protein